MSNFVFAQNIENATAAKAAQSATAKKTLGQMTDREAIERIINAVKANDGITRAIVIEPTSDKTEVWLTINRSLPSDEKRDIARAIRPAIRALGGHPYLRYRDGRLITPNFWLLPADRYKAAMAAYNFWNCTNVAI